MESKREEAAPTFPTWKRRLEEAPESKLREEVDRFLEILKAVGTPMIDGTTVHFIYYDREAQRVVLTGEFTQWGRRGIALTPLAKTGIFYHSMEFRGPVRVEYKFIVDGKWMLDPFCPNKVDNGIGEQNSFFVVGDFQEPPELEWVPTIPHGRVEEFDFKSKVLRNSRRAYVYLPPDYGADSAQRFPTLYVHDGGEYLTRARLATVLDNLLHSREIPPLIAVMVDPVDRAREYWANEDYGRFTEDELIPYIDEHYRTLAQREARGVMGASLGGLISTYLALSRPHLFSKAGGQSSAFFLEREKIVALVRKLGVPIAFYFDVGKYEPQFIPAHQRLVPLLEAKGCPCFFQELAGGHNWTSWRAHLKDLLTFLWGGDSASVRVGDRPKEEQIPPPVREQAWPQWDIDALLNRFLSGWERLFPGWIRPGSWDPQAEIAMEGDKLICRIALPGVDPRNIEVLVVGSQLVIRGERKVVTPGQGDGNSSPLHPNQFERTFPLPEGVSADNLTARYHDGVLEISMPAPKGMTARRIPIE
jgi:enterochelin esterase-like enzyme/HSP20 family molecular chaperone IbpA